MTKEEGFWNSTKDAAHHTWEKTKEVSENVWDKTKEVSSDMWEGTKNAAGDVKDFIINEDKSPKNQDKHYDAAFHKNKTSSLSENNHHHSLH